MTIRRHQRIPALGGNELLCGHERIDVTGEYLIEEHWWEVFETKKTLHYNLTKLDFIKIYR